MKLISFITFILYYGGAIYCQDRLKVWSLKDGNYDLSLNFEDQLFKIDSMSTIEGTIYLVTFPVDTSYIRLNYVLANSRFECCDKTEVYLEIESCKKHGITDRNGKIVGSNLYWREITDGQIQIVYSNCPSERTEYFNRILNSINEQISYNR